MNVDGLTLAKESCELKIVSGATSRTVTLRLDDELALIEIYRASGLPDNHYHPDALTPLFDARLLDIGGGGGRQMVVTSEEGAAVAQALIRATERIKHRYPSLSRPAHALVLAGVPLQIPSWPGVLVSTLVAAAIAALLVWYDSSPAGLKVATKMAVIAGLGSLSNAAGLTIMAYPLQTIGFMIVLGLSVTGLVDLLGPALM